MARSLLSWLPRIHCLEATAAFTAEAAAFRNQSSQPLPPKARNELSAGGQLEETVKASPAAAVNSRPVTRSQAGTRRRCGLGGGMRQTLLRQRQAAPRSAQAVVTAGPGSPTRHGVRETALVATLCANDGRGLRRRSAWMTQSASRRGAPPAAARVTAFAVLMRWWEPCWQEGGASYAG